MTSNPPRLLGAPLGLADFKRDLVDFEVEEVLGFEPSGDGEHCLVWVEKADRNTNDVAAEFATRLGIRKRLVSHCGLKDRNAITRQWFSLHLPGQSSPSASELETTGVRVLKITRHLRKLHRGTHQGNRFAVRLRNCTFSKEASTARWEQIARRGVPNYFGKQRFGRDGGNLEQARRFMAGELEVKNPLLRGILISATRSAIFNACVSERIEAGNWDTALEGEVFGFPENRSLVLPHNIRGDEAERVKNGSLELTAPLWGLGELQSEGQVKLLEEGVAQRHAGLVKGLSQFNLRQERRVMRLRPLDAKLNWETDSTLTLSFGLPKGTYATTLLREMVDLNEPQRDQSES